MEASTIRVSLMEPMRVVARILYVICFNGIWKCASVAIANM